MKIFDIAQTCSYTGDAEEDSLHDSCLNECCLAAIRDTSRPLQAWVEHVYNLLIRGLPPCPIQPGKSDDTTDGTKITGICPVSKPVFPHHHFLRLMKSISFPSFIIKNLPRPFYPHPNAAFLTIKYKRSRLLRKGISGISDQSKMGFLG